MKDYEQARVAFGELMIKRGLRAECRFVPLSQSRNATSGWQSLNWKCDIYRHERAILSDIDYGQGSAHCPAYKATWETENVKRRAIGIECESGKVASGRFGRGGEPFATGRAIAPPDSVDVIASLVMDSGGIDYSGFDEWAADFGYDPDSRAGFAIYETCLRHGLALRAAIGDSDLCALRDLAHHL